VTVFITSNGQPLVNNVVDRALTQLVAGPLLIFVDTQPQILSEAVGITAGSNFRSGSDSGNTTITTQTISPAQASAILSSASSSAIASAAASA